MRGRPAMTGTPAAVCLGLTLLAALAAVPGSARAQDRTMGLILREAEASEGYTLFAPMPYTESYLIDPDGDLVQSWPGTLKPGLAAYLGEDGLLLRTNDLGNLTFYGGGRGGRVEARDWDGEVAWSFDYSNTQHCLHHDIARLPNGNVLMLAWEYKTRDEALAAGRNPARLSQNCLWPDHVIEFDPEANGIVWEWHVWDHLIQDFDSTRENYGDVAAHPELIDVNFINGSSFAPADWNHSNSVAYNAELDQVIISVRQLSELWVIDHSTTTEEARRRGDLLYRWGNPFAYRRGLPSDEKLYGPHDIEWIAPGLPGAGNILIFNNGYGRFPGPFSEVIEIVPPCDSTGHYTIEPGAPYGPAAPVWTYRDPDSIRFYSSTISGCQRLPSGNTLICSGETGDFFEGTPDGRVVWRYISPVNSRGPMRQFERIPLNSNSVFKVRRYQADYPGLAGRELLSRGPIEQYPQSVETAPGRPAARADLAAVPNPVRRGSVLVIHAAGRENRVEVRDACGRLVRALLARKGRATWDGRDERGLLAPAGVYYARASAGGGAVPVVVAR
ncbi:MAG: aryl-sulfate sulfotransferase [bacterium]